MTAAVYLFDDSVADGFYPFALSRPCGEMLYGRWTLRERASRLLGADVAAHVSRPWLGHYAEPGAPEVVDPGSIGPGSDRLYWSSRAIPAEGLPHGAPLNLHVGGSLAGVLAPAGTPSPPREWFAAPEPLDGALSVEIGGTWLDAPWDIVASGPDRLRQDLEDHAAERGDDRGRLTSKVHVLGDGAVMLGEDVTVEPGVLLDTRDGPIELDDGVEVRTGTRLAGPVYAGPHGKLLGGAISSLSAGPYSYLRGELEEVTVFGYCNKAHDGFIGHAALGRWVNLGAMTTNSDLKNNYGSVRMGPPDGTLDTGLVKLGSLIGDHAKTGIGVLLNTGTVIGAGSNLFGADMPPKWVPPFSWGAGEDLSEYRRDAFIETAARVMPRRGVEVTSSVRTWLAAVWEEGRT